MLTIYKASAGSGKTYTLALEYIKLLLGRKASVAGSDSYALKGSRELRNEHRHILGITFTNKATEEMKSRIVTRLDELARDADTAEYGAALMQAYRCDAAPLQQSAATALHQLLCDYRHFHISTIDSFFQSVLRTFAREVDHQGDYDIELDDAYVMTAAVGMMLDDLNYGDPKTTAKIYRWLQDLAIEQVDKGKDFNIFNRRRQFFKDVVSFVKNTGAETFKACADRVHSYLNDDPSLLQHFKKQLNDRIKKIYADLARQTKDLSDMADAELGDASLVKLSPYFEKISATDGIDIAPATLGLRTANQGKTFRACAAGDGDDSKMFAKTRLPKGCTPSQALCSAIRDWAATVRDTYTETAILSRTLAACPSLEVLSYANGYVQRFRQENNLILLSDTNDLLRRIIKESETPFIYERMGVELEHFLIDEFQDTSRMQWQNLKPLVSNSLGSEHDNLIIGDEKQAIYRFRNSDSSMLGRTVAKDDFPNRHIIKGTDISDNSNHRSAHAIVRFNNTVFRRFATDIKATGYGNVTQGLPAHTADITGYVAVTAKKTARGQADDVKAEILKEMTAEIERQHSAGYDYGQIAVLVRGRKDAADVVEYLLVNAPAVKVASDEALLLRSSQAVKMIISVLEILDKAADKADEADTDDAGKPHYASLGDVLKLCSRFEYHYTRCNDCNEALSLALADDTDFSAVLAHLRRHANLVELIEAVIDSQISEERRAAEMAYIAALQDYAIDFSARYNPSLHEFLKWWYAKRDILAIPSGKNTDGVSVMTIHKAKGLEWDCVHIPFANWDMTRNDSLWLTPRHINGVDDEVLPPAIFVQTTADFANDSSDIYGKTYTLDIKAQQLDNINLAYVAFTRARRELCVWLPDESGLAEYLHRAIFSADPTDVKDCEIDLTRCVTEPKVKLVIGDTTTPEAKKPATGTTRVLTDYHIDFDKLGTTLTAIIDSDLADRGTHIADDSTATDADADADEAAALSARRAMARRGTVLHGILSEMTLISDLDRALRAATTYAHLSNDEAAEYRSIITEALGCADSIITDRWFSPEATIRCEQPILCKNAADDADAKVLRPDRIVQMPDGSVDIIDYKFTSRPHDEHLRQVAEYIDLMHSLGYQHINGYLWYPQLQQIIPVNKQ
ncbi:MAG: UvrD-helicase domain-containing protein [Muribaculaceae bacterium]